MSSVIFAINCSIPGKQIHINALSLACLTIDIELVMWDTIFGRLCLLGGDDDEVEVDRSPLCGACCGHIKGSTAVMLK